MAGKAKLHELIAVQGDVEGAAKKILEEAAHTFKAKDDHFLGMERSVKMLSDSAEAKLQEISEAKEMVTTVGEKLDYISSAIIRYYDVILQKDLTNQKAVADIVVDGKAIASGVPSTYLLGLEDKLKALRATYEAIPTHPPGSAWIVDEGHAKKGVCVRKDDEVRVRTQKITKPVVLYEATANHPAQIEKVTEDVPVGRVITRVWSGAISPAEKSDLLGRIDTLLRAVKKARQRANATEVVKSTIGKTLLDYINTGSVSGAAAAEVE